MKAVLCKGFDGPAGLSVEEIDRPSPQADEAIVKVAAVGLNFFDTLIIAGKYQVKPALPFSPGGEIAGSIIETGAQVTHLRKGDRVMVIWAMAARARRSP